MSALSVRRIAASSIRTWTRSAAAAEAGITAAASAASPTRLPPSGLQLAIGRSASTVSQPASHWSIDPLVPVRILDDGATMEKFAPTTLHEAFARTVAAHGSSIAMRVNRGSEETKYTFQEFMTASETFARALLHNEVALERGEGVTILAFNCPEWSISAYGACFAGGIEAGIYTSNSAEQVHQLLELAHAAVIVVDEPAQLAKVLAVAHRLPLLRAVILTYADAVGTEDRLQQLVADAAATGGEITHASNSHTKEKGKDKGKGKGEESSKPAAPSPSPSASSTAGAGAHDISSSDAVLAAHASAAGGPHRLRVYGWGEWMGMGSSAGAEGAARDAALRARLAAQQPGHAAALIYTSGTTGASKAAMLSHDNIIFTARAANVRIGCKAGESVVSYLPLSHVAAQLADVHANALLGSQITFASPDALKGTLVNALKSARPHFFLGVPRVYEKIQESLMKVGAAGSPLRQAISRYARRVGHAAMMEQLSVPASDFFGWKPPAQTQEEASGAGGKRGGHGGLGRVHPGHASSLGPSGDKTAPAGWRFAWPLVRRTLFSAIYRALGFDRADQFGSGAAPVAMSTLHYFASLGIVVREVYGLSESTGPHAACTVEPGGTRLGTVGRPIHEGVLTAIDEPDPLTGEGEICMRGRNVFMGYARNGPATEEVLRPLAASARICPPPVEVLRALASGDKAAAEAAEASIRSQSTWLHTGDVGVIDAVGFLRITGRLKELLKTAGGENVAPVPIEQAIKDGCPDLISQAVVVGDRRKHLAALVTLRTVVHGSPPPAPAPTPAEDAQGQNQAAAASDAKADTSAAASAPGTTLPPGTQPAPLPAANDPAYRSAHQSSSDPGVPSDTLDEAAQKFLARLGVTGPAATSAAAAAQHPAVAAAISAAIASANKKAVSNAARVPEDKWAVVAPDFSVHGGEMTPTLKLKRKVVTTKHAAVISRLYGEVSQGHPRPATAA